MPKKPRLQPPVKGVASAAPFVDTPDRFTALEGERNVRAQDQENIGRVSTRPGFQRQFPLQLGTAAHRRIQGLKSISRASATTSYALGPKTVMGPTNALGRAAGLVALNVGVLNPAVQGLREAFMVAGTAGASSVKRGGALATIALPELTEFPATSEPEWVCTHPTGSLAALGFNYVTAGGQNRTLVLLVDIATGNYAGVKVIAPAGENILDANNQPVLGACWTADALWMARGTALWYEPVVTEGGRTMMVDPLRVSPLVSAADPSRPLTAASRIVNLSAYTLNGRTRVWAAFEGSTVAGATSNPVGLITAGTIAKHFRSGLFLLEQTADVADNTYRLATVALPDSEGLLGDGYVEVSGALPTVHSSVRFSAWLTRAPRGALPTALAADPVDGSVYVAFTNQGWGPTAAFPPDGSAPYTTLAKFSETGNFLWEDDTASNIGAEQGGKLTGVATKYPCDIPDEDGANAGTTSHDGPAIRALACNGAGSLYASGRINGGRWNVFGRNSADGSLRWQQRTEGNTATSGGGGSVAWPLAGAAGRGGVRNGLAIDPTDAQVIIAGARNDTWKSTDPAVAHQAPWAMIWKLAGTTGAIQWGFSATQDDVETDPTCLSAGLAGVVYGCNSFTDV